MKRFVFLVLTLGVTGSVWAEDCGIYQTQTDINLCSIREMKRADQALNLQYRQIMSTLSKAEQVKLKQSERNWIKSKENNCRAKAYEYEGGSMQPMVHAMCLTEKARDRMKWLRMNYQ